MSGKIFGDVDLTVHVMRNPVLPTKEGGKSVYNGLVFQVNCQDCETPTRLGLSWGEVRILLDGGAIAGIERVASGWEVSLQCQNREDECSLVNKFIVTDEELEKHAELEVSRRTRVARAQGLVR